ncbi:MAG TPA: phosphoribosyltransferase family protein [Terriglobia bacterium]|nr:phosphoribosyltransferase family protein [Terriglobia bacterium]
MPEKDAPERFSNLGREPRGHTRQPSFTVEGKTAILLDDVLYTGRTTRAALDALVDHGRPRRVELCALIDRGHREVPIEANYVAGRSRLRTPKLLRCS